MDKAFFMIAGATLHYASVASAPANIIALCVAVLSVIVGIVAEGEAYERLFPKPKPDEEKK